MPNPSAGPRCDGPPHHPVVVGQRLPMPMKTIFERPAGGLVAHRHRGGRTCSTISAVEVPGRTALSVAQNGHAIPHPACDGDAPSPGPVPHEDRFERGAVAGPPQRLSDLAVVAPGSPHGGQQLGKKMRRRAAGAHRALGKSVISDGSPVRRHRGCAASCLARKAGSPSSGRLPLREAASRSARRGRQHRPRGLEHQEGLHPSGMGAARPKTGRQVSGVSTIQVAGEHEGSRRCGP